MPHRPDPDSAAPPDLDRGIDTAVVVADPRWLEFLGLADEDAAAGLLQPVAEAALAEGGRPGPAELALVLTDNAAIHALNRDYRGVDKPTNVLSFALAEAGPGPAAFGPAALGDVLLAFETVAAEAREQGRAPRDYARHLVAHGVLHLIGYDHQQEAEAESMERLEARVLAGFGIGDPYADSPDDPVAAGSGPSP